MIRVMRTRNIARPSHAPHIAEEHVESVLDQTTSTSRWHRLSGTNSTSFECLHTIVRAKLTIAGDSKKNDPMYLISKLLMNSLYGRFGMDINLPRNSIMNNETITEFINNKTLEIEDILDLENGKSIVVYKNTKNKNDNDISTESQVNISIAAAITAYSRIIMSKYLGDTSIKV